MSIRNVRNSFVKIFCDGETDIAIGPRARDGQMSMSLYVRENGEAKVLFDIDCIGSEDSKTILIKIENCQTGEVIFNQRFNQ